MKHTGRKLGLCVVLVVTLSGTASAWSGGDLFPLDYLRLTDDEGTVHGELLLVQRLEGEREPSATILLVATPLGERAELIFVFDPKTGVGTERFVDRSSGWWAELEHDIGLSNLGSVEEHGDSSDWAEAIQHRAKQQQAPSTFTLRTSEGREVAWVVPWQQPEEGRRARRDALAELAAQIVASEPPESVRSEMAVLTAFLRGDEHRRLSSIEDVTKALSEALSVADRLPPIPQAKIEELSLVSVPEAERPAGVAEMLALLGGEARAGTHGDS